MKAHQILIVAFAYFTVGSAQTTSKGKTYNIPGTSDPGKTITNGKYLATGKLSDYYRWQASGSLKAGGCGSLTSSLKNAASCYVQSLGKTGNLARRGVNSNSTSEEEETEEDDYDCVAAGTCESMDSVSETEIEGEDLFDSWLEHEYQHSMPSLVPIASSSMIARNHTRSRGWNNGTSHKTLRKRDTPRQRDEVFTYPPAASGQVWTYTWKSYIKGTPTTSKYFFHLWQVLRRDGDFTPTISLLLINGKATIADYVRGCSACDSTAISNFASKIVHHTMTIKYGKSGSVQYRAYHSNKKTILSYSASGDMGADGSLKIGPYRRVVSGMSSVQMGVMSFQAKRTS